MISLSSFSIFVQSHSVSFEAEERKHQVASHKRRKEKDWSRKKRKRRRNKWASLFMYPSFFLSYNHLFPLCGLFPLPIVALPAQKNLSMTFWAARGRTTLAQSACSHVCAHGTQFFIYVHFGGFAYCYYFRTTSFSLSKTVKRPHSRNDYLTSGKRPIFFNC